MILAIELSVGTSLDKVKVSEDILYLLILCGFLLDFNTFFLFWVSSIRISIDSISYCVPTKYYSTLFKMSSGMNGFIDLIV